MMKKLLLTCLLAGGALFAADPLERADAYSLEITPNREAKPGLFPIGLLGDHGFRLLPFFGLNLCERSHSCYEFKDGKPCNLTATEQQRGFFFFNVWAAHTIYNSTATKHYGSILRVQSPEGKDRGRQYIRLHDANSRTYVLAAAAATVDAVMKKGDEKSILVWGIDNEWESPLDYSGEALAAFREFLPKYYGNDLAKFRKAWRDPQLTFEQAVPPPEKELAQRPGAWLDWRRFQEESFADFLADYFKTIADRDPRRRPVVSKSTQCTIEMQAVVRNRAVNHELLADRTRAISQGRYGIDQYGHGDRNTYELSFLYNCIRPNDPADHSRAWGIFSGELNNHAGPGWQFAQSYWRILANGFKGGDFFVLGSPGAKLDYATFGMTSPDGSRRERFHYLGRLAAAIHRTEAFWTAAAPARGALRLAILMPQRDVLLAADNGASRWDYSTNNRLSVYNHLRSMGYWVEVIPYGKLAEAALKEYQALFLVGAEHLSAEESANIVRYVENGGKLYADMRAGGYDEHHLETEALQNLLGLRYKGVYTGIEVSPDDLWYADPRYGNVIRADGKILYELAGATLRNPRDLFESAKAAAVTSRDAGRGRAYWFNTRLGALRPESAPATVVSEFFAHWLRDGGVEPGYRHTTAQPDQLRVEQPMVTANGDTALIVAGTTCLPVPAGRLQVRLPAGTKAKHAFWAPAENALLQKVPFSREGEFGLFDLPAVPTAGILYLFDSATPLLGIGADVSNLKAGENTLVRFQLANPGSSPLPAGQVTLRALGDWEIAPYRSDTPELAPGELRELIISVTPPKKSANYRSDWVYPLVGEFHQGGERRAVGHQAVTVEFATDGLDFLLSDNVPNSRFPRDLRLWTGAAYRYLQPEKVKDSGSGLTDGLDQWNRRVQFHSGAEVVFDLQKTYQLTGIRLRRAVAPYPAAVAIAVSEDGKEFRPAAEADALNWDDGGWAEIKFSPEKARFIRVRFRFAGGKGGWVEELEVYGRP